MSRPLRIAVGGIHIECSTYNPALNEEKDFRVTHLSADKDGLRIGGGSACCGRNVIADELIVATGQGDADSLSYARTADASALKSIVAPFGNGSAYAKYLYYQKVAPNVDHIVSNTDGPLADPFKELSRPDAAAAKGGTK